MNVLELTLAEILENFKLNQLEDELQIEGLASVVDVKFETSPDY